ncbi:MAG TPA: hypothetical protein VGD78_05455 [Chthoniobacterales bacterium]
MTKTFVALATVILGLFGAVEKMPAPIELEPETTPPRHVYRVRPRHTEAGVPAPAPEAPAPDVALGFDETAALLVGAWDLRPEGSNAKGSGRVSISRAGNGEFKISGKFAEDSNYGRPSSFSGTIRGFLKGANAIGYLRFCLRDAYLDTQGPTPDGSQPFGRLTHHEGKTILDPADTADDYVAYGVVAGSFRAFDGVQTSEQPVAVMGFVSHSDKTLSVWFKAIPPADQFAGFFFRRP